VSIVGVPVGIAHGIFFGKILLGSPHLLRAVRVLLCREWTLVFWDVDLILGHQVMNTRILLVLEEGVGDTEIVIGMNTDGQLTWNRIPRVLVHFPDRGVTICHHGHFIISTGRPQDFNLLTLGVSNDLSANISLVSFIEDIDSHIDDKVRVINLFIGGKTKLLNTKSLTSSEPWNTSQKLLDVSRLGCVIPRSAHVTVKFLDILHGPGAIVCRDGSRLSNRMDVSHVINGRRRVRVECLDVSIKILGGG